MKIILPANYPLHPNDRLCYPQLPTWVVTNHICSLFHKDISTPVACVGCRFRLYKLHIQDVS